MLMLSTKLRCAGDGVVRSSRGPYPFDFILPMLRTLGVFSGIKLLCRS